MRINLSSPFHLFQWYSYILIIFTIQIIIILPLSCIIFYDLYNRLISRDSIIYIPLNTLTTSSTYKFEQNMERYDFSPLPLVNNNGIIQTIPLRSTIDYKLDLKLDFYCQHRLYSYPRYGPNMELLDTIKLKIWINNDPINGILFKQIIPVICSNKDTSELSLLSGKEQQPMVIDTSIPNKFIPSTNKKSFMDKYHDNWINKLDINDLINIPPWANSIHLLLDSTSTYSVPRNLNDNHYQWTIDDQQQVKIKKKLTFQGISHLEFRTVYDQGIRNFMLIHPWITYIVGTTMIHLILVTVFLVTGLYWFYKTLNKFQSIDDHKD